MRTSALMPSPPALLTLGCLLWLAAPALHAQKSPLESCSETLHRKRQALTANRPSHAQSLFPALDPTYQKIQQAHGEWAECVIGQRAPLSSFKTIDGEPFDRASLAGRVLVINFWFMGCAPCRAEMPALNRLVGEYEGKDVLFLGFSTDTADRLTPSFFERNPFDFKIVAEAQSLTGAFHLTGYPTTYVVDQRGIIRQAWIGFTGNGMDDLAPYRKAKSAIDNLLKTAR